MRERSIVFINQNAGYLMIDIINAHKEHYEQCAIITGKIINRNTSLHEDIAVERIVAYNRTSTLKRLFTWCWGFVQILFLIKTKYRKSHLYIVSNPPMATLLPLFCNNRYSLLIFDVYPDALAEYKILKKDSVFVRMWQKANKKIFPKASHIFTLSHGMKGLLSQYVAPDKISVTPIWTDNSFLKPLPKNENLFIRKYDLAGKFLVIYSGNLGLTHDLEVLVEVAAKMQQPNIVFVIIGEGEKKKILEERIKKYALQNCMLLPWQEVSMLPYSLAAADLAVVTLGKEASLLSVPSKTYNLMSVGAPLLCIADQRSELAALVDQYQFGKCFDPSDVESITAYIRELASNEVHHTAFRSRSLAASKEFGSENAFKLLAI